MAGVFPPEEIELIPPFGVPLLNTFILLASGGTVTWAHHAVRSNDRKNFNLSSLNHYSWSNFYRPSGL